MPDQRPHREHRLDQHTVIPRAALAEFEVRGIALRGMEGRITQNNHPFFTLPNQPRKGVSRDMGGGTRPRHHQAILVQQQAQFQPPIQCD